MADDRIIERIYAKGDLLLTSPLILGSGEDENTDIDILRDWDGKPFIPGTSLAGAIRYYLGENYTDGEELADKLFGKHGKESRQSLIIIHDARFKQEEKEKILVRDGVHLDFVTRTVVTDRKDSKYDYEIMDAKQSLAFKIQAVRRANSDIDSETFRALIGTLLSCLTSGKVSVGAKTRRGYGEIKFQNEHILVLDMSNPDDVNSWINFEWDHLRENTPLAELGSISPEEKNVAIRAKFKIPYSILIRHYSEKEEYKDADASHIQSNDKSVIPGTSWNGAIRHAAYQILLDLDVDETNATKLVKEIFGFVDEKQKDAAASRLSVKESIIENGSNLLKYTRNKVDRFTGGVVDSALFDEMPHYQGAVELDVILKKEDDENDKWRLALIKMALMEIGEGIQPVGGAANIGRGILELVGDIAITDDEYQALQKKLEA